MLLRPDDDRPASAPLPQSCHDSHRGRVVSNIRRTRRMVSSWDWTRGVKRLPDFYNSCMALCKSTSRLTS